MRPFLASLLIAHMALMPLAGLASQGSATADTQEMPYHGHDGAQTGSQAAGGDCSSCLGAHGCCAGSLMPLLWAPSVAPGTLRIRSGDSFASGFVPDQIVPPPLSR